MKLSIISGQFSGLFKCLDSIGLVDLGVIDFYRVPFRGADGMWRCGVYV